MVQYWDYCIGIQGLIIEKDESQANEFADPVSNPTKTTNTPQGLNPGAIDTAITAATP